MDWGNCGGSKSFKYINSLKGICSAKATSQKQEIGVSGVAFKTASKAAGLSL